jgi:prepilin-type N-terminal cleavage/methylation domain-containing protein/prepilin-type processing-associated H-X9-DG protein
MSSCSKHKITPAGFTLVELLIVVAVIAVITAFLIPAVRQGREHANRAACMSNLRQWALALTLYDTAYGQMPNGRFNYPNHVGDTHYNLLRDRFSLPTKATLCPAAAPWPTETANSNSSPWHQKGGNYGRTTYYYLAGYGSRDNDNDGIGWYKTADIWPGRTIGFKPTQTFRNVRRKPSSQCLLMTDFMFSPRQDDPTRSQPDPSGYYPSRSNHTRRSGYTAAGINVLFADSHVEWHNLEVGKAWHYGSAVYWNPGFPPPVGMEHVWYLLAEQ